MEQDFLTADNIGNFTFQLFAIVAATQFTKKFVNKIYKSKNTENKCESEFIVLGYSLILSIIRTLSDSNISWHGFRNISVHILLIPINAFIISYLASASYSKIVENKTANGPK